MEKHITLPLTEELADTLHAGDTVYLTGTIYTSRDAGHKRMCETLAKGEELPFDVSGNIISATISHAFDYMSLPADDLARAVWRDICQIRGVQPAFVPEYRVLKYPRATLLMTPQNNALRPDSCFTKYSNLFLAGDWTMKNWPCSLEAAARSGKRASSATTSCASLTP